MVSQLEQASKTLDNLRTSGLIDGAGVEALAQMILGLAAVVDDHQDEAPLWNQYRQAWGEMRKEVARFVDGDSDQIFTLLERLDG